jgi:iron complex transport system substrate-binding protein
MTTTAVACVRTFDSRLRSCVRAVHAPPPLTSSVGFGRRRFLIGAAAVVGLAACGDDDTPSSVESTRTVSSSRGDVQVPVAPKRVATLVGSADIDVLTLGFEPVFSGSYAAGWVDIPTSTVTSDVLPPSAEAVAATRPDLLIGWDWLVDDAAWDALSRIAPAVTLPEQPDTSWRDVYLIVADAVNERALGEAKLAEFDDRVAALRAMVEAGDPITVNQIGVFDTGTFWWWGQTYPVNEHLTSVGITVDAMPDDQKEISIERLAELTAPWIIVSGAPEIIETLQGSPLWEQLPAVQAGQVIVVDRDLWGGAGLIWANALLDDIQRLFVA